MCEYSVCPGGWHRLLGRMSNGSITWWYRGRSDFLRVPAEKTYIRPVGMKDGFSIAGRQRGEPYVHVYITCVCYICSIHARTHARHVIIYCFRPFFSPRVHMMCTALSTSRPPPRKYGTSGWGGDLPRVHRFHALTLISPSARWLIIIPSYSSIRYNGGVRGTKDE